MSLMRVPLWRVLATLCFWWPVSGADARWARMPSADFEIYRSASQGKTRGTLQNFERERSFFEQEMGSSPAKLDPNQVLEQTRASVQRATRNLPRFTCLETVDRQYFDNPPVRKNMLTAPAPEACPAVFVEPDGRIPQWTDRLRLEVTVADGREIHAWPTASEFDTRPIDEIVEGPITTGGFGGYLSDVFDNPGTHFTFMGDRVVNGRMLFEFAYRIPLESSHYSVGKVRRLTAHG